MPRKQNKLTVDRKLVGPGYGGGIWSKLVKRRAGYRCEVCGERKSVQSHHIISKTNRRLRYDLRNGACLCAKHHTLGNRSAHKNPVWFTQEWMVDNRCEDLDYLMTVYSEIKKWTLEEMQELLGKYEKEYAKQ